jgi:hypothetical protein
MSRGFVRCPFFLSLSGSLSRSVGFLSCTEQNTDLCRCRHTFRQCKTMVFPTSAFHKTASAMPRPKVHPANSQRAAEACSHCKASKKECTGTFPCLHCIQRGHPESCVRVQRKPPPPWTIPPALPLMAFYHSPSALPHE